MGKRGYILLKADIASLDEKTADDQIWNLIQALENINDIEYVSNTIGEFDFIASIDTQKSIESVAEDVKKIIPQWINDVVPLTENNLFKKHRELKDLEIFKNLH